MAQDHEATDPAVSPAPMAQDHEATDPAVSPAPTQAERELVSAHEALAEAERKRDAAVRLTEDLALARTPIDEHDAKWTALIARGNEALERAAAAISEKQARVDALERGRAALIDACAKDPARRAELRALSADLTDARDDLEIAKAAYQQADAAAAEIMRGAARERLAMVRERANGTAFLRDARADYIKWIIETEREAARRWSLLQLRCDTRDRLLAQERELCTMLGCAPSLVAFPRDAFRTAANVGVARSRANEERANHATEGLFAAVDAAFIQGPNGFKQMHPLLRDEQQLEEGRAILDHQEE